jgi:hypothetical protein
MPCLCLPFSSPIHRRSLRPSIPKGAPRASATLPRPPHQRHLLHLSVASPPSSDPSSPNPPPLLQPDVKPPPPRIPSCCRRIVSRHHQVSSSPPPPPLSLRVLGAATVALLRMSRRWDALPRLTALPLSRRLKNYGCDSVF